MNKYYVGSNPMIRKFSFIISMTITAVLFAGEEPVVSPSSAPAPIREWTAYSNSDYGFSISYPKALGDGPELLSHGDGALEIAFPDLANEEVGLLAYTELNLKEWEKNQDSNDDEPDHRPPLKELKAALKKPVGGEIVILGGKKAVRKEEYKEPDHGNLVTPFYVYLGGQRWLDIILVTHTAQYDPKTKVWSPKSAASIVRERALQESILRTLKFLKPS